MKFIADAGDSFLLDHIRIQRLQLSGNEIGDDGLMALLPLLVHCFRLDLNDIGATDVGFRALARSYGDFVAKSHERAFRGDGGQYLYPRLAKLYVERNLITQVETIEQLMQFEGFSDLGISGNPVYDDKDRLDPIIKAGQQRNHMSIS
mmetsp:Transcript_4673/g.9960  ORF Transcript_4673/g.9960 Transcript_4673/m.9960 type:complete len:148 (-) Transcript_4673:798-1241(-)